MLRKLVQSDRILQNESILVRISKVASRHARKLTVGTFIGTAERRRRVRALASSQRRSVEAGAFLT